MLKRIIKVFILIFLLSSCSFNNFQIDDNQIVDNIPSNAEKLIPDEPEKKEVFNVTVQDEGQIIYYSNGYGYRYGPSIMKYEDGSMDMWLSAPGNSGSQWDWITYRHSDDGVNWSNEYVVLKPTPGSKDQCSVCDPGVIYFNGYYYLAYTATDYYAGKGTYNSAFVARSQYPYGPFEKWNGEGWGGYPQPIIQFEGNYEGWGIGEVSFVIKDEELYIYYTYFDTDGGATLMSKAQLTEDWPLTITKDVIVCGRKHQDSLDVVYADDLDTFLGFAILQRMSDKAKLIMYRSEDGENFVESDTAFTLMKEYAHNVGISKDKNGHFNALEDNYISYGFGSSWGKWNAVIQKIRIQQQSE